VADAFPNPLTGDPNQLEADGNLYSETSDAIAHAIGEIRQLGSDLFSSHAITALDRNQGDVVEKVTRVQYRYHEAGGALVNYAKALREAQTQAANAIAAHGTLSDQASTLVYRIDEESRLAHEPGPDQMVHIMQLQQLMAEQREVQARQADAQRMWNDAKGMKDAAAQAARIAIHVGDEKNDLHDDLWDSLATLVPVLLLIDQIAQTVLKIVSLVLTILAIVFAVLSLIFPILAPVAAALFGYAQIVNLAIAVLALLAFLMNGFHLMDLVLVGVAIVATFGAGLAGGAIGAAAQGAISNALSGFDEVAGNVIAAVAKNAIAEGVTEVTKAEVGDLLFHGSSEADQLFNEIGGPATDGLNTLAAPGITDMKDLSKHLGFEAGGYVKDGLNRTAFPEILHMPFRELSSFADSGGLGNLDWAKDGWNAVQTHIIDPAQHLQQAGNRLAATLTHWDPGGQFSAGATGWTSGDVTGDSVADAVSGTLADGGSAASDGGWGGGAQWVMNHLGPGPLLDSSAGAVGDRLGDIFGNIRDDQSKALIKFETPEATWGSQDWDPAIWGAATP
jgi:hypothetical protein